MLELLGYWGNLTGYLKDEIYKSQQNTYYSYYQHVRPSDEGFGGMVIYEICNGKIISPSNGKKLNPRKRKIRYHRKQSEATHLRININDRKTDKKINKLIRNKKVSKSASHDPETEIYDSPSRAKLIGIKYDKHGSHLRVEFKLINPGIKGRGENKQEESKSNETPPIGSVNIFRYIKQKIKESKSNEKPQNNEKEPDRLERLDMRNPQSYINLKAVTDEIINSLRLLVLDDPNDRGKLLKDYKGQINKIRAEPYVSEKFGEYIQARKGDADKAIENQMSIFLK